MSQHSTSLDPAAAAERVAAAASAGHITSESRAHIERWLTEPEYAEYRPQLLEHVAAERWQELNDAFWTVIPFGTGGRRGRMYPIGTAVINDRTVGESAQGLADYVRSTAPHGAALSCAIAYDTRHRSRDFAELCAEVMVAAGFQVHFLDGHRSTPELSYAVRAKACSCGIMITASHNPPSDNAIKVYWSTGGQLLPPHDGRVIEAVTAVKNIARVPFSAALGDGRVAFCQDEIDAGYIAAMLSQSRSKARDLKILYSPLHGVGATSVCPVLAQAGFGDVEVFAPHAAPDGDFPNVPGHVANPENPTVFDAMIEHAIRSGAELIMATDPDADRLGCAARRSAKGPWQTLTGNEIGALLAYYVLEHPHGTLTPEHYVVKTLVTTELIRRVADHYNVKTEGNLLVGFKWIGGLMDQLGPERFVLGTEESYGFLVGDHTRDKDAGVAALLLAELAALEKRQGRTLHQLLDHLFVEHGCHLERTFSITMPGAEGMQAMQALMARLREQPPRHIGDTPVAQMRDYVGGVVIAADGRRRPLDGPSGDMVIFDLSQEGNYVAVRPSGTEPKVKFYLFVYEPPRDAERLAGTKRTLEARLDILAAGLRRTAAVD